MHEPVSARRGFYPPIEPDESGFLPVDGGHELYWERVGAEDGLPAVVLHGGPGGGINPWMRRYFDAQRWRVTLFDQRGCGRSRPFSSLEHNTTWDLVADIERFREIAGVDSWTVFGGSWGSTLALAYAQTHPERVRALILRGVFLLMREEMDWLYRDGANRLFPDAWERLIAPIPEAERSDLIAAFHRRLTGGDPEARREAARAWAQYEGDLLSIAGPAGRPPVFNDESYTDAFARIETHYFVHDGFFARDGQLLKDAGRLAGIPCIIVNGRYDALTPPRAAFRLHEALPGSRLVIVPDAGHAASDPGIVDALVRATDEMAGLPARQAAGR